MLDVIRDVKTTGRLKPLEEILWEWTAVIERTVRAWAATEDVPWWYNERASLSMLAGAIWRAGGIAFEEFSSKRTCSGSRESIRRKQSTGRVDLHFNYHAAEFVAEVKQCWPMIGSSAMSATSKLNSGLDDAGEQVLTIEKDDDDVPRKLAIVFAGPVFPESQLPEIDQRLNQWKRVIKEIDCQAYATFWKHDCKKLIYEEYGERFVYPGAGIFVREVT